MSAGRPTAPLLSLLALAAGPAMAQDTRHPVAPDNNWSIDDSGCVIDAGWEGDIGIVVNPHDDHHDLGVYDPALTKVKAEEVITVRFAAEGRTLGSPEYQALGHRDGKMKSYVSDVDDKLLDDIAAANAFQFYRGETLEIELDMTGFAGALAAIRQCEAAPQPDADAIPATDIAILPASVPIIADARGPATKEGRP